MPNLGVKGTIPSTNPSEDDDLEEDDANPFHQWNLRDDHRRHRRSKDQGHDLNVKIGISEYHGNLRSDDFMEWIETIKQVYESREVPHAHKVKLRATRLQGQGLT